MSRTYRRGLPGLEWDQEVRYTRPVRLPRGVTLADLIPAQRHDPKQVARNARAMRRVAAGLPACSVEDDQCPVHKHEAPTPGRAEASTTHAPVAAGDLGGCIVHGRA